MRLCVNFAESPQQFCPKFADLTPINGRDGKSAYEIAVDNGFAGTEEEWLESLRVAVPISGTLPEPREDLRGRFWIATADGTDKLYICVLKAGEPYWLPLNGGDGGEVEPDAETTSVLGMAVLGNMILGG